MLYDVHKNIIPYYYNPVMKGKHFPYYTLKHDRIILKSNKVWKFHVRRDDAWMLVIRTLDKKKSKNKIKFPNQRCEHKNEIDICLSHQFTENMVHKSQANNDCNFKYFKIHRLL